MSLYTIVVICLTWNSVRAFDRAPFRRAVSHYVRVMGAGCWVVGWWSGALLVEQLLWDYKEKEVKQGRGVQGKERQNRA